MAKIRRIATFGKAAYIQRIKSLFGSSLIGYWPLSETSGTTANDVSGNARHATYTGISLNNTTSPNRKPAPLFGTSSVTLPAAYRSAFNGSEGTIGGWARYTGSYTDGVAHYVFYCGPDASNTIDIGRTVNDNEFQMFYRSGALNRNITYKLDNTGWFHFALTWSKSNERARGYINGMLLQEIASLNTWTGLPTPSLLGFNNGAIRWTGNASDVFVLNREATPAEIKKAASGPTRPKAVSILGDSISDQAPILKWWHYLPNLGYNSGYAGFVTHAVAGQHIAGHMAAQVLTAANDNADVIILALGANDDNLGDMNTLQDTVETAIIELRASNPNARIYYLNVLPRWTDISGTTESPKGNIRAAISDACFTQAVTCWDTYNTPWIVVGDTSDGTHPTAAGHAKIAAQVLARL